MLTVMGETGGRVLDRVCFIVRRLTRMSQKTLERLEHLRRLNSNRQWVNYELYRLLYQEDLYIVAYERIKSKPGNMTPGTDEETLDGFSLETIRGIIQEMRTEQFRFKPVRTTFIPKTSIISIVRGEKKRPTGGMHGVVRRREAKTSKSMRM